MGRPAASAVEIRPASSSAGAPEWLSGTWAAYSVTSDMLGGEWKWTISSGPQGLTIDRVQASELSITDRRLAFRHKEEGEPEYEYVLEIGSKDCLWGTWRQLVKLKPQPGRAVLVPGSWGALRLTRTGRSCPQEPMRSKPLAREDPGDKEPARQ